MDFAEDEKEDEDCGYLKACNEYCNDMFFVVFVHMSVLIKFYSMSMLM